MAQSLNKLVKWTKSSDVAYWKALGFGVINDTDANTRTGNDSIIVEGIVSAEAGFDNARPLSFGPGLGTISVQINIGAGSEQPSLLNRSSIRSSGSLSLFVNSNVSSYGNGIVNLGTIALRGKKGTLNINVKSADDTSILHGGLDPLGAPLKCMIEGGRQNDSIIANGIIDILSGSQINLAGGRDRITAAGISGASDYTTNTIRKDILTGDGADEIDVSSSYGTGDGLTGACIDLGNGDDSISCYGTARIDGGKGLDTLLLPFGSYQVMTTDVKGCFLISNPTANVYVQGFEQVGSFDGTLSTFKIGSEIGILTLLPPEPPLPV